MYIFCTCDNVNIFTNGSRMKQDTKKKVRISSDWEEQKITFGENASHTRIAQWRLFAHPRANQLCRILLAFPLSLRRQKSNHNNNHNIRRMNRISYAASVALCLIVSTRETLMNITNNKEAENRLSHSSQRQCLSDWKLCGHIYSRYKWNSRDTDAHPMFTFQHMSWHCALQNVYRIFSWANCKDQISIKQLNLRFFYCCCCYLCCRFKRLSIEL